MTLTTPSESGDPSQGIALVHGTAGGLFGRIAGNLSQYLFQASVGRVLGVQGAGVLYALLAVANILANIARGGLDRNALRLTSIHRARGEDQLAKRASAQALGIVASFGALLAAIAFPFRDWLARVFGAPGEDLSLVLVLLAVPAFAVAMASGEILRGAKRMRASALVQFVLVYGIATACIWLAWRLGKATMLSASLAFTLGAIVAAAVGVRMTLPARQGPELPLTLSGAGDLFAGAPYHLLVTLVLMGMGTVDVVILGYLRPGEQTALYFAATRTSLIPTIGAVAVNQIMMPLIGAEHKLGSSASVEALARMGARWGLVVSAVVTGGLLIAGPSILLVFGGDFAPAYSLLIIMIVGQLVNAACGPVAQVLLMTGGERSAAVILSGTIGIVILFYLMIVPSRGAFGAACVTASGVILWNLWMVSRTRRMLAIRVFADNLARTATLLVASTLLALLVWNHPLARAITLFVYCLVAPVIGWRYVLRPRDRETIGTAIHQWRSQGAAKAL